MAIILYHAGNTLPIHIPDMLNQLRFWNPTERIIFLASRTVRGHECFSRNKITFLNRETLRTKKVDNFLKHWGRKEDDFWTVTATRFFYISECMRVFGIQSVFHTENDVLVYHDGEKYRNLFQTLVPYMAITPGGPDKCMTGWMFIRNYMALDEMLEWWTSLLSRHSHKEIKKRFETDMVNEMSLLKIYMNNSPKLIPLPILPFGDYSNMFVYFNSVFDPASYGQLVGGTREGVPGAKPKDHYIGQYFLNNPMSHVVFRLENNCKVPYLQWTVDDSVRINNLHIHSKQLYKYVSYD